jgi:hypothetical protein
MSFAFVLAPLSRVLIVATSPDFAALIISLVGSGIGLRQYRNAVACGSRDIQALCYYHTHTLPRCGTNLINACTSRCFLSQIISLRAEFS